MSFYFIRKDNVKQEEEDEDGVESEDEVEIICMDTRDNNEVDPLAIPIKQEIFETPRVGVIKNLVPVLSNSYNPLRSVKTEYLPHQTSSSNLNEFNNLRVKLDPENYDYDLNDDCPSPPSPSPSIFELSSSDDEAVVQKSQDTHDIRIIDLVPELSEYMNKDNKRQVKTTQPNQTDKTSQIEISLKPVCRIRPEENEKRNYKEGRNHEDNKTQVSTSHQSTTTKTSQQNVSLTPLYRTRSNENEKNNYKEKTQLRECKIILHKLPDSFVEQCNIPLREERGKALESPEPENFARGTSNIKYEYSCPSASVKYECSSLSPPSSIHDWFNSEEEIDETLVQEENSTLAENKLQTSQELSSPYENDFETDITLLSKNGSTLYHCNVCLRSFKRHYDMKKHMKSMIHKIEKDKQIDMTKISETITHLVEQKGDSEFVCEEFKFDIQTHNLGTNANPSSLGEMNSESRVIPDNKKRTESNSMESVKYTQIKHQGRILFTCNYCNHSTKRRFDMEKHCKSKKHNDLLEVCSIDSAKDNTKTRNSVGDISTDLKTKINTCDICGFKATDALSIIRHKVRFHSKLLTKEKTRKKKFDCNLCDYTSEFLGNLKRHKLNDHTILTLFTCQICKTSFKDINKFNSHKLSHSNKGNETNVQENPSLCSKETSYKCPICVVVFKDYYRFEEHNKSFHVKEKVFFCDLCDYKSDYSGNLKQHKIKHHSLVNVYTCQSCKTSFKSNLKFKAHKCINLKETFCCDICENKFKSQSILNKHRLTHLNMYKCSICTESFEDYYKLANHNSLHLKNKIYNCDDCDFKTGFNCSLRRHKLSFHSGKKMYKCVTCHTIVKGYDKFLEHKAIHYKKRKFSCDICKYTCNFLYILHKHKSKYHSSQSGFVCSICNVSFEDFNKLRIHKTTHVKGLLFNCDYCEYKSNVLHNIKRHKIAAHSNIKIYTCRHCNARITGYVKFLMHKSTHIEGNKFNCNICEYKSSVGCNLKKHKEKYHSAPMAYTCETCKATFDNPAKYRIHKTIHLEGKTFSCNLCEYKTEFRGNVKSHMKRHHSNITFKKHKSTHVKTKSIESSVVTNNNSSVDNQVSQFKSTNSCEKVMRCNFCLYTTTNMSHFLKHKHKSHLKKLLSCDKCEYTTKISTLMRKHKIKIHAVKSKSFPVKIHKCNICKFTTIHRFSLFRHKTEVHSKKMQVYTCHICKETFKRIYNLKSHLLLHRNKVLNKFKKVNNVKSESNKTFDCKFCKTSFSNCGNLNKHMKCCYVYLESIKTESTASKQNVTDPTNISDIKPIRKIKNGRHSKYTKNFVCKICSNAYTRQHCLKRHMVVHSGQEPYKCNKCFYTSYDKYALRRHKTRIHPEEENRSIENTEPIEDNKSTPFKKIQSLNAVKDLNIKSGQKIFNCSFCKAVFKTIQQVRNHSRYHLGCNRKPELKNTNKNTTKICNTGKSIKYKFLCKICSHRSKNQNSLDKHMILHFGGKPYKCDKCTFRTAYRSSLSKHKRTHKKTIPISETVENNILGSKTVETNMVKERTENFDCCVCNAIFKTHGSLIKHMKHHFPDVATDLNDINTNENLDTVFDKNSKIDSKKVVSKITKVRSKNTKQYKSINTKKVMKCNICFHNFYNKANLQRHLIIHSGIKPFTCDKCNYMSNDSYNLKRHKRNKHGERRTSNLENNVQNTASSSEVIEKNKGMEIEFTDTFDCSFCNTIFNTYDSFMEHMKCHISNNSSILNTKEENNVIKQNIKTDLSLNSLPVIQHSEVNSISKFSCNICLRNFSHKQSLAKHMILHGREKSLACDKCNWRTNYAGNLKRHKQRKHVTKEIKLIQSLESVVDKNVECKLPLNCSVCKIIFNSSVGLMEHMKYHEISIVNKNKNMNVSDEPSVNKDLIVNTKSIIQYSKHIKTTTTKSKLSCNICLRTYSSVHSLRRHKFLHTGTFACDKCSYRSNYHANLKRHKDRVHLILIESTLKPSSENVEENQISSSKVIGDNYISDNQSINRDLNINTTSYIQHRNIKCAKKKLTFKCIYCLQNYSSQHSLDRHKLRHTGEKPYACEKCIFRTYDQSILKRHKINSHSGQVKISIDKPSIENSSIPNSIPFVESTSVIQTLKSIDENISVQSSKSVEENISIPSSVSVENISTRCSKLVVENISIPSSKSIVENIITQSFKSDEENVSIPISKSIVHNISVIQSSETSLQNTWAPSSNYAQENITIQNLKHEDEITCIPSSNSFVKNIYIPTSKLDVEITSIPTTKSVEENVSIASSNLVVKNKSIECSKSVLRNIALPSLKLDEEITSIQSSNSFVKNIYIPNSKLDVEITSIPSSKSVVENTSVRSSNSAMKNICIAISKSVEENISIPSSNSVVENKSMLSSKSVLGNIALPSLKLDEEITSIPSSKLVKENTSIQSSKSVEKNTSIQCSNSVMKNICIPTSKSVEENISIPSSNSIVKNKSIQSSKSVLGNIALPSLKLDEEIPCIPSSKSVEKNTSIQSSKSVEENRSLSSLKSDGKNVSTQPSKLNVELISVSSPKSINENKSTPISLSNMEIISIPRTELVVKNKSIPSKTTVLKDMLIPYSKPLVKNISVSSSKLTLDNVPTQSSKSAIENISLPNSKSVVKVEPIPISKLDVKSVLKADFKPVLNDNAILNSKLAGDYLSTPHSKSVEENNSNSEFNVS